MDGYREAVKEGFDNLMSIQVIFPDLTELGGIGSNPNYQRTASLLKMNEPMITTPAAICYTAEATDDSAKAFQKFGWTLLRVALNWHNTHGGDRVMRLWYKSFRPNKTLQTGVPEFCRAYPTHFSSRYGCGAGYIEGIPGINSYITRPKAYLMLYRVVNEVFKTFPNSQFARKFNCRCVFQTDTAHYFANGFPPSRWKGKIWEQEYWKRVEGYKTGSYGKL